MRGRLVAAVIVTMLAAAQVAAAEEAKVAVRFAGHIPQSDAARLASAMRANLAGTASVVVVPESETPHESLVVDVDRTEAGFVLHFRKAEREIGAPRIVAHAGEIGATEAGAIVRAFVVAANVPEDPPSGPLLSAEPPPKAEVPFGPPSQNDERHSQSTEPRAPPASEATRGASAGAPAASPVPSTMREMSIAHEAPSAPPPAVAPWHARLGAHYTGAMYAQGLAWQSGVRIDGAFALSRLVYVGVAYANHPERSVASADVTVLVGRHNATAFVGFENDVTRALALAADVGAGVDVATRSTSRVAAGAEGTPNENALSPTFTLRAHVRWRIPGASRFALDLAPGLDVAPAVKPLVIEEGGQLTTLVRPLAMRVHLDAGGTFDLF